MTLLNFCVNQATISQIILYITNQSESIMTTTKPMDKTFNHQAFEEKLTQEWQDAGYFCPQTEDKPYCIMLPPPNVTGHLHMGHGFQLSLMDALIRYHHMKGHSTLWQAGTEHAGIATQMVVETQLKAQNQSSSQVSAERCTGFCLQYSTLIKIGLM